MQLQFSVAAIDRKFSKAMRRIRPRFSELLRSFESVILEHPIHQAILVLVTDDEKTSYMEEVENSDGFFQVMAGCANLGSDDAMASELFSILEKAALRCPFAVPDRQAFEDLFNRFRPLFQVPPGA